MMEILDREQHRFKVYKKKCQVKAVVRVFLIFLRLRLEEGSLTLSKWHLHFICGRR